MMTAGLSHAECRWTVTVQRSVGTAAVPLGYDWVLEAAVLAERRGANEGSRRTKNEQRGKLNEGKACIWQLSQFKSCMRLSLFLSFAHEHDEGLDRR
jgi:hypothetical protein